jgi:hypothetical protein
MHAALNPTRAVRQVRQVDRVGGKRDNLDLSGTRGRVRMGIVQMSGRRRRIPSITQDASR